MNPSQIYRGPSSIEAQSAEQQTVEKSVAVANAYENKPTGKKNAIKSQALSAPAVQRKFEDQEEIVQKTFRQSSIQAEKSSNSEAPVSTGFQTAIGTSKGNGQKLDTNTQGFMAGKFGANFGGVNIHNNSRSHQLATQINAKAFTVGNDIYFGEGEYQPATHKGKHLLAHELTHTLQQKNGVQRHLIQRKCDTKSAIKFYTKTKLGKKIQWTTGLIEELYKVVGKVNKPLYENAKASGKIDASFVALVCKTQEILGIKGEGIDGKIGPNTIKSWENWSTGGKKGDEKENSILYSLTSGTKTAIKGSKEGQKTAIWQVDKTGEGYDPKEPWKTATKLKYVVGKKTIRKGITGNDFRDNHPLKTEGTDYGAQVYVEDLLDLTAEFSDILKKNSLFFENEKKKKYKEWKWYQECDYCSPEAYTSSESTFADLVGPNKKFDLKSRTRKNLDQIPSYAAIEIGEWTFFKGHLMGYDDYGNIAFGYWGKSFGFSLKKLKNGADWAQLMDTYTWDPIKDQLMIEIGFNLNS